METEDQTLWKWSEPFGVDDLEHLWDKCEPVPERAKRIRSSRSFPSAILLVAVISGVIIFGASCIKMIFLKPSPTIWVDK